MMEWVRCRIVAITVEWITIQIKKKDDGWDLASSCEDTGYSHVPNTDIELVRDALNWGLLPPLVITLAYGYLLWRDNGYYLMTSEVRSFKDVVAKVTNPLDLDFCSALETMVGVDGGSYFATTRL